MTQHPYDDPGFWAKCSLAFDGLWPGILDEVSRVCPEQKQRVLQALSSRVRSATRIAIHLIVTLVLFLACSVAIARLTGLRLTHRGSSILPDWQDFVSLMLFFAVMVIAGAVLGLGWRRADYRRLRITLRELGYPVCVRCGYLVHDRAVCPECGTPQIRPMGARTRTNHETQQAQKAP